MSFPAAVMMPLVLAGVAGTLSGQRPLSVVVRYPAQGASVIAGDSLFLFGSVSDRAAAVTVDGRPVPVDSGGGWLAWVPFPHDSAHRFEVVARLGTAETRTGRVVVRGDWMPAGRAAFVRGSMAPVGRVELPQGEPLKLSVVTSAATAARLLAGGRVWRFEEDPSPLPGAYQRALRNFGPPGEPVPPGRGVGRSVVITEALAAGAILELASGRDTLRVPWEIEVRRHEGRFDLVTLHDDPAGAGGTDGIVHASARPGGAYLWRWPNGTTAWSDGVAGEMRRIRLADGMTAWVPDSQTRRIASSATADQAVMGTVTVRPHRRSVEVRISAGRPVPVEVRGAGRRLDIVLHGAVAAVDWIRMPEGSAGGIGVVPRQQGGAAILELRTDWPVWGHRVAVEGDELVVSLRRPPGPGAGGGPLAGLSIGVDAGHPPGGACGPTGYCEAEANLDVAERVAAILRDMGAGVVMTRPSMGAVSLERRIAVADSADVDILVSIHHNGLPDGVNPRGSVGTSTFFHHPGSEPLADAVQRAMVAGLRLPDLGIARGDLALVRPSWYPAILVEGMHLMEPSQERLARSPAGRAAYAAAVAGGIAAFWQDHLLSNSVTMDRPPR